MTEQKNLFPELVQPEREEPKLDLKEGRRSRDEGMKRVDENSVPWSTDASRAAAEILNFMLPGTKFTGEDLRLHIERIVGEPPNPNSWGAVIGGSMRSMRKNGAIEVCGYVQAKRPSMHAHHYPEYIKVKEQDHAV